MTNSTEYNEFRPLFAPQIGTSTPGLAAEPVDWFQEIDELLPIVPSSGKAPARVRDPLPGKVKEAFFLTVEEIAYEEKKLETGEIEPPEITIMRLQAAEEAQQVVGQALEQAQQIERTAREEGFRNGYDRGYEAGHLEVSMQVMEQAKNEREACREDLTMFVNYVEEERRRAWVEMEPQIVGLVFDLARQVIKQEITASRTVALSVIRNALRRVSDSGSLRIRVNPTDLDTVRSGREDMLALLDGIPHIEIVEDRRVGMGGCIVDTDNGTIDARIENQMHEVALTLEQTIGPQDKAA